jgi:acetate kinase
MNILVLNAGSASLRFEVIATPESHTAPEKRSTLVSGIVEGIGEEATFSLLENKQTIRKEKIDASDYGAATRHLLLDAGPDRMQVQTERGESQLMVRACMLTLFPSKKDC